MKLRRRADVSFLFLGETLLVPHLWPVVDVLAALHPEFAIDVWVGNSDVERLIVPLIAHRSIRLCRAPGYGGGFQALPARKLVMLGLLARHLRVPVVVCAEQTSLWLPTAFRLKTRYVKTSHGAGSVSARDDKRRRAASVMLVPGALERQTYLDRGFDPAKVIATGYVKSAYRPATAVSLGFDQPRPTVIYVPHWRARGSSWWQWGRQIVAWFSQQNDYNFIFAPHQRLIEGDAEVGAIARRVHGLPHGHSDLGADALIDGSFLRAADIYLGDCSSQVVEFAIEPRPCVFLNAQGGDWRGRGDYGFWNLGEVVSDMADLKPALARAQGVHALFAPLQRQFAELSLGTLGEAAPRAVVDQILKQRQAYYAGSANHE